MRSKLLLHPTVLLALYTPRSICPYFTSLSRWGPHQRSALSLEQLMLGLCAESSWKTYLHTYVNSLRLYTYGRHGNLKIRL